MTPTHMESERLPLFGLRQNGKRISYIHKERRTIEEILADAEPRERTDAYIRAQKRWKTAFFRIRMHRLMMMGKQRRMLFGRTGGELAQSMAAQSLVMSSGHHTYVFDAEGVCTYIFDPHSKVKLGWDVVLMLLVIYNAISITFNLAFEPDPPNTGSAEYVMDRTIDALFITDIIINFNTSYVNDVAEYETRRYAIARRYLRTWFFLDLVASIPTDPAIIGTADNNSVLRIPRLVKFLRLFRLLRLMRIVKFEQILLDMDGRFSIDPNLLKIFKLGFWTLMIAHLMTCMWYGISAMNDNTDTWVDGADLDLSDKKSLYVAAAYWVFMTMTTVGYGDLVPQQNSERVVAIILMSIGSMLFAYIVGNISSLVQNLNQAQTVYNRKMESLQQFMKYRKMPEGMRRRLRDYFEFLWSQKTIFDEQSIMEELSTGLRQEVAMFLNRSLIQKIPFFDGADPSFVTAIVTKLHPMRVTPGEYIVREGDVADCMFLVNEGMVDIVIGLDDCLIRQLGPGSYFGESSLLFNEGTPRRTCSAKASTYCELYSLTRTDLLEALRYHEDIREALVAAAVMRRAELEDRDSNLHALTVKGMKGKTRAHKPVMNSFVETLSGVTPSADQAVLTPRTRVVKPTFAKSPGFGHSVRFSQSMRDLTANISRQMGRQQNARPSSSDALKSTSPASPVAKKQKPLVDDAVPQSPLRALGAEFGSGMNVFQVGRNRIRPSPMSSEEAVARAAKQEHANDCVGDDGLSGQPASAENSPKSPSVTPLQSHEHSSTTVSQIAAQRLSSSSYSSSSSHFSVDSPQPKRRPSNTEATSGVDGIIPVPDRKSVSSDCTVDSEDAGEGNKDLGSSPHSDGAEIDSGREPMASIAEERGGSPNTDPPGAIRKAVSPPPRRVSIAAKAAVRKMSVDQRLAEKQERRMQKRKVDALIALANQKLRTGVNDRLDFLEEQMLIVQDKLDVLLEVLGAVDDSDSDVDVF